jgi:hypothetical protein
MVKETVGTGVPGMLAVATNFMKQKFTDLYSIPAALDELTVDAYF